MGFAWVCGHVYNCNENGKSSGLNFVNGNVNILPQKLILPVIGWKKTIFKKISSLNKYNNTKFYYVHSYAVENLNNNLILSKTSYEDIEYISSFQHENYFGTQFHPEKVVKTVYIFKRCYKIL